MAQLYFKYGAMGSSKTANALMTRFNYEERGQKTLLVKPRLDTRDGDHMVVSRIGLTYPCIYFDEMQQLSVMELQQNACVIVDEAQFLTREEVMYLVGLVDDLGIPVICYGLRADFKGDLFPGSEALLVMADKIEEVKTICWCGKKATFNARFDAAGKVLKEGEQVVLGANDQYIGLCRKHWMAGDLGPDFRPEDLLALLSRIMPDEVLPLFSDFLQKAYQKSGAAIISLSALTAAWSASRGIYGISKGLSAVLDVPETRSYLRLRLLCLFYMLLFVLGLVLTLLFHVFGQRLLALLTRKGLPLAGMLSFLLEHLQLYSFLLLTALFSLLYLALPDRRQRLSAVFPGALAAAGAWLLFSALFSVYVNHFAKGLALYGSLTTMVLTMLWVYACVSIVFYGAFLNRLLLRLRTGA